MEENKVFSFPTGYNKYILRSNGEEVEVVAFAQIEDGARSGDDWVTYIDSKGTEHIKEHLNLQLDFKAASNSLWDTMTELTKTSKYPSTRNNRIFELTKELIIKAGCVDVEEAIRKATEVVDMVGIDCQ